jgi:3-deoxy-D-manno-octulosonate 8-phosphate phosphatase (KDO 8-P phosphatase)
MISNNKQRFSRVKVLIFDVDGVLSDGKVWFPLQGDPIRNLHNKDGYALQLASKKGYTLIILSGGSAAGLVDRFKWLGIQKVFIHQSDKIKCYEQILVEEKYKEEEILYMGDDLPDYEVMKRVGLAACPKDSSREILDISHYIASKNGGEGCVREVIEQVMRTQGTWEIGGW